MECDMRPMVVTYDHWSRWGIPRDSVDRVYAYDVRPVVVEYDEWFNCDQWACNTTSGRDGVYLEIVHCGRNKQIVYSVHAHAK